MADIQDCFRFLDLPGEIRNKIYRELLCNFTCEREPTRFSNSILARLMRQEAQPPNGVCQAEPDINISILLVNRQVYGEAYDIMVKTNQFIRIRGYNFNFADVLMRSQLPVVTMDREHAAQFQGYLLCMDVGLSYNIDDDNQAVRFDFMILGRHWEALCLALSHLHISLSNMRFRLAFDPAWMTGKKDKKNIKASVDRSFMAKTEEMLLYPFRTHLRGIDRLNIYTRLSHAGYYDSVLQEVAQSPLDDIPAWLALLEQKCQLGNELQAQKKTIEASGMYTEVLGYLTWAYARNLPSSANRYNHIVFTCHIGESRCFLHHLEFPPEAFTDTWLKTMLAHAWATIQSMESTVMAIQNAAQTAESTVDAMWMRILILESRFGRLKAMRSTQPIPLSTIQNIARSLSAAKEISYLLEAKEITPDNEEIEKERHKLLELSGLQDLTLEDIANVL